jgi:thioredoxin reductase (NADPH)
MDHRTRVLIIGSGPAGYTAAIYAARAGLKPLMVQGMAPGGQLTITTDVENYPGFADVIQGPWLMEQMQAQAAHVGTEMIFDVVTDVDFDQRPFVAQGDSGDRYIADAIIVATGAEAKWLGLESEKAFQGFGVSACATCDGFFFREKPVVVVGGGNTAVEEALYLTNHASKVTLVHDRLFRNPKVEVVWNAVLDEVVGDQNPPGVTGVRLRDVNTDAVSDVTVDGVFIAIGHRPNTDIFKGKLDMDDEGYLITAPDSTRTNIPGVFAAGDVKDKIFRQAVTAAGLGCMAALETEKHLAAAEDMPLAAE